MSAVAPIELESQNSEAWTRLENSPQWKNLTDQQRLWVTQFLASGSALAATKAAYHAKPTNARVLSYELAKNPSILAALDVAAGKVSPVKSERERLIAIEQKQRKRLIATVRKQLAAAEEGSIAAQKFTAQLERLEIGLKLGPHVREDDDDDEPVKDSQPTEAPKTGESNSRIPAGATPLRDANGVVKGYRTAENEYVQLATVEVVR